MRYYDNFRQAIADTKATLLTYGTLVDTGHWQGVPTEGRPDLQTVEVNNLVFTCPMPVPKPEECEMEQPLFMLRDEIEPNLPWADDHFDERVSRVPSNPGEQYMNWPWWRGQDDTTRTEPGLRFTHTYQERYWPKHAADRPLAHPAPARDQMLRHGGYGTDPLRGIRYDYGDLDDLVGQLLEYPWTRQAYLPIFFPEDTGNVHRGRIPCTLGYHFMLRGDAMHMWYFIRSCDYIRHFRDDLYLSARLLLWVLEELERRQVDGYVDHTLEPEVGYPIWRRVNPGNFTFVCPSLHYHRGDEHLVRA